MRFVTLININKIHRSCKGIWIQIFRDIIFREHPIIISCLVYRTDKTSRIHIQRTTKCSSFTWCVYIHIYSEKLLLNEGTNCTIDLKQIIIFFSISSNFKISSIISLTVLECLVGLFVIMLYWKKISVCLLRMIN